MQSSDSSTDNIPDANADRNARDIISVSELNLRGKQLLETHFSLLWVVGEISNFSCPASGHWYFTLKDERAQVRCAMFKNRNQRLRIKPGNGDQVVARVRVSLYEGRGEFQLIVEHLERSGAGALQRVFEELKAKLQQEGLFDKHYKQTLPRFIHHVGVITSPTGAAIRDIVSVLGRRFAGITISLLPVSVQGDKAPLEICHAIDRANRLNDKLNPPLDILLIGRGGGSLEDLQAFNDETVARAIFQSQLPTVSAVGHETDFTIADFVADIRAPTPSAAAELISEDADEWLATFISYENLLNSTIQRKIQFYLHRLDALSKRLRHPGSRLREQAQRLDDLEIHLRNAIKGRLMQQRQDLLELKSRMHRQSPAIALNTIKITAQQFDRQLGRLIQETLKNNEKKLNSSMQLLDTVSPLATLQRGYAIIENDQRSIIRRYSEVNPGEQLRARLGQGSLLCTVNNTEP